ncbi:MAG: dihydroorotate dehydrogenase [Candidatus Nanopelagicales bacterium]|jgi:dihydroorotate dehydrogenase (NAD+) catalytic subunit|nr:dihydroorotate dehydrogenase [Candidatus Nanopelagicales bacterium]
MTRTIISTGKASPGSTFDLRTHLGSLELHSPVLTASGCAAAGRELDNYFDITAIGGIVTKSIMLAPRSGRATPRMAETPSGMLNSIGLQGPGVESFLETDLAWLQQRGARTIVSIAGGTADEFGKVAAKLRVAGGFDAIEVNISCPNVEDRGQVFACRADTAAQIIQTVRRNSDNKIPIFAKLSPDVTDIVEIAASVSKAGATGVSVINTLLGMVIDTETMRPALAGVTGGLSGPAIRPVAVRCIWQIRSALPDLPIIGMGGVRTGHDALEMILAGANAISVGTSIFNNPAAPMRIQKELEQELRSRGFESLAQAISFAHREVSEAVTETAVGESIDHGEQNWDFISE